MWATRTTLTITLVLLLTGACTTLTGRPAGQFASDTETTGRVKAAMAVAKMSRVNVDTMNGTVFLTGTVDSEDMRQRAGDVARSVTGTDNVVNNVTVRGAASAAPSESTTAASPSGAATAPPPSSPPALPAPSAPGTVTDGSRVPAATPPTTSAETSPLFGGPIARLERLGDGSATSSDQGPWAAYDKDGRLVATVYAVPGPDVQVPNPAFLTAGDRPIRSVSVVPHPAAQGQQYLVVLWHVTPESAAVVR
jgi:BON domain-containing protein